MHHEASEPTITVRDIAGEAGRRTAHRPAARGLPVNDASRRGAAPGGPR